MHENVRIWKHANYNDESTRCHDARGAAAASGIGATIPRAIQSCNAVSYRLTMQLIAVAVGLALTAISMGPIGKRFLSNKQIVVHGFKGCQAVLFAPLRLAFQAYCMVVLKRLAIQAPSGLLPSALCSRHSSVRCLATQK